MQQLLSSTILELDSYLAHMKSKNIFSCSVVNKLQLQLGRFVWGINVGLLKIIRLLIEKQRSIEEFGK